MGDPDQVGQGGPSTPWSHLYYQLIFECTYRVNLPGEKTLMSWMESNRRLSAPPKVVAELLEANNCRAHHSSSLENNWHLCNDMHSMHVPLMIGWYWMSSGALQLVSYWGMDGFQPSSGLSSASSFSTSISLSSSCVMFKRPLAYDKNGHSWCACSLWCLALSSGVWVLRWFFNPALLVVRNLQPATWQGI